MNCLKTISVERDFGKGRLILTSVIFSGIYFLLFFTLFRTFLPSVPLIDYGPFFLILVMALVVPVHLIMHCLPLWLSGTKAICGIRKDQWPYLYYSFDQSISKHISITSTVLPAIVITISSIVGVILFPQYIHYIALVSALNAGLCVFDMLNFKQICMISKQCLIEEHRDGFYILRPIRYEEAN
ncbi:DUF3267 domain-containing protein [Salisediminibacterium beveridgei]|uniref:Zincin peptidase n=1 Tax=Salisediminibacterium beveridgei TaxID=632773 RepID=A0A1D7QTY7_9BACI|nr:DUF3267 domain-containing protein [Salisediminibacterium beveridgei]AOM82457.1 hypothetical protein BBEV_1088 [Salisediminibacterium beveridgei]